MKTHLCTGFESTVGMSRRNFLNSFGMGLGGIALGSLLKPDALLGATSSRGSLGSTHFAPKAKRVIYLFQSGGPSQIDLYDHLNQRIYSDIPLMYLFYQMYLYQ